MTTAARCVHAATSPYFFAPYACPASVNSADVNPTNTAFPVTFAIVDATAAPASAVVDFSPPTKASEINLSLDCTATPSSPGARTRRARESLSRPRATSTSTSPPPPPRPASTRRRAEVETSSSNPHFDARARPRRRRRRDAIVRAASPLHPLAPSRSRSRAIDARATPVNDAISSLDTIIHIPRVGLGTWRARPNDVRNAVRDALLAGYSHVDCAAAYANEREVGEALAEAFAAGVVSRRRAVGDEQTVERSTPAEGRSRGADDDVG